MKILLFDPAYRIKFAPLSSTRAIADFRMGMFTIKERWQKMSGCDVSVSTIEYLQPLYDFAATGEYIFVPAEIFPTYELIKRLKTLGTGEALADSIGLVAAKFSSNEIPTHGQPFPSDLKTFPVEEQRRLSSIQKILEENRRLLALDFENLQCPSNNVNLYESAHFVNPAQIFIEEGASISFSVLNATDGPIYIGKDSTIMEGCLIRGPFSLGARSTLKMGTKIYGATCIGPNCMVGGEVKNSVIFGNSNKAHDGYLGDSVVGEWCNLGAGTSNSNLKNTAGPVSVWNEFHQDFLDAGPKAGVIMGDYTRTAINTSINTGSVMGVCCNVFGSGLTPKHLPDFSWGEDEACKYNLQKAFLDIDNWKKMKGQQLSQVEKNILEHLYSLHQTK